MLGGHGRLLSRKLMVVGLLWCVVVGGAAVVVVVVW